MDVHADPTLLTTRNKGKTFCESKPMFATENQVTARRALPTNANNLVSYTVRIALLATNEPECNPCDILRMLQEQHIHSPPQVNS